MRLHGREAIEFARRMDDAHCERRLLHKYEDPCDEARTGLTVAEAEEIAKVDPSLIFVDLEEI